MSKQLLNLINKFGADKLHQMIDETVAQEQDYKKLQSILVSKETASNWFKNYCSSRGFECKDVYDQKYEEKHEDYKYRKSCLAMNNWRCDAPYVYLWLNNDSNPHFEIGSSIHDLWGWPTGYNDLILKIDKVVELRNNA